MKQLSFFFLCLSLYADLSISTSFEHIHHQVIEATPTLLTPRSNPLKLSTSILIPCVPNHLQYIPNLLTAYSLQSLVPNEIVIALSEIEKIDPEKIDELEKGLWPFSLKIITNKEKKSEGTNFNLAREHATSDLLIAQPADDIPHPQRVEIIQFLFENYEIDQLIHTLITPGESFLDYEKKSLDCCYLKNYIAGFGDRAFHNGAIAITKKLSTQIPWVEGFREGTDTEFNKIIHSQIKNRAALLNALILYRIELSTYTGCNKD